GIRPQDKLVGVGKVKHQRSVEGWSVGGKDDRGGDGIGSVDRYSWEFKDIAAGDDPRAVKRNTAIPRADYRSIIRKVSAYTPGDYVRHIPTIGVGAARIGEYTGAGAGDDYIAAKIVRAQGAVQVLQQAINIKIT